MKLTDIQLKLLHGQCTLNRGAVYAAGAISCFSCLKVTGVDDIKEWTDCQMTPICPKCQVDACLPGQLPRDVLQQMKERWF